MRHEFGVSGFSLGSRDTKKSSLKAEFLYLMTVRVGERRPIIGIHWSGPEATLQANHLSSSMGPIAVWKVPFGRYPTPKLHHAARPVTQICVPYVQRSVDVKSAFFAVSIQPKEGKTWVELMGLFHLDAIYQAREMLSAHRKLGAGHHELIRIPISGFPLKLKEARTVLSWGAPEPTEVSP